MALQKKNLLANFGYAVLDERNKNFQLLKDEEEVQRWIGDGSIGDGDIIIKLTPEVVRVAELKNFIELK